MTTPAQLEEIVRRAWMATLAPAAMDPASSWEETGADSLQSLKLLLRLEEILGRRLSFDIIYPDMTIADLALTLAHDAPATGVAATPPAPTLFLVPGIFGDEPILADFRRWFGAAVQFTILELPAIDRPAAIHLSMTRTGAAIAEQITRRQPHGAVMIAGYSFGGGAAYEAARVLMANGRRIALLCMFDVTLRAEGKPAATGKHRGTSVPWTMLRLLAQSDMPRIVALAAIKLLRPQASNATERLLLRRLRLHAIEHWQPTALPVPILLAIAADAEDDMRAIWLDLHPGAVVVRTPGGHSDIFRPAAMARLGPAVLAAITDEERSNA